MTQMKLKEAASGVPVGALKPKAACRYLGGISEMTMRRLIESGQIKPCRNLRHLLIPTSELDRWLAEGQFHGKGGAHHE
jgi:excisionase family DNA binding protein